MSMQNEVEETMLSGITRSVVKTVFGVVKDEDGKIVQTMAKTRAGLQDDEEKFNPEDIDARTKTIIFDFEGVVVKELLDFHATTTTIFKKWYNDNIFNVTDEAWIAKPKKIEVSVRKMIDETKRGLSPKEKRDKVLVGMTLEELEAQVAKMKASLGK